MPWTSLRRSLAVAFPLVAERLRFLEAARDARVARRTDLVVAGDLVRRDVPFVAGVAHPDAMRVLFQAVARHSGQLTNFSQLAGRVGVDDKTARRYLAVLERLYLVRRLPPCSATR